MKQFFPACLIASCSLLPTAAPAADFVVNRFDDPVPGECLPVHCTLREAVIAANNSEAGDIIILADGVYLINLQGSDTSENVGDLDIDTNLTIRGTGQTVIDGQQQGRLIDVRDASLTLENLTLRNANTSLDTNGTLNGGAVNASTADLTLRNVRIEDCSAQSLGGGLFANDSSTVVIEDSHFEGTTGGSGGALHTRNSDIQIRNSQFIANRAESTNAGALYFQGAGQVATISNSLFQQNESESDGGAIYHLGGDMTISDSTFDRNMCPTDDGGAIAVSGSAPLRMLKLNRVSLVSNTARSGAALSVSNNHLTHVQASLMDSNTTTVDGGAVKTTGGDLTISNSTLTRNEAANNGGAIWVFSANLNLRNSTLSDNTADTGMSVWTSGTGAVTTVGNTIISGDCVISGASQSESLGGNVESPGDTCGFDQQGDQAAQASASLDLEPLLDNGGSSLTQAIGAQSIAKGSGIGDLCDAAQHDQRYAARKDNCDSGAYETEGTPDDFLFGDQFQF